MSVQPDALSGPQSADGCPGEDRCCFISLAALLEVLTNDDCTAVSSGVVSAAVNGEVKLKPACAYAWGCTTDAEAGSAPMAGYVPGLTPLYPACRNKCDWRCEGDGRRRHIHNKSKRGSL